MKTVAALSSESRSYLVSRVVDGLGAVPRGLRTAGGRRLLPAGARIELEAYERVRADKHRRALS